MVFWGSFQLSVPNTLTVTFPSSLGPVDLSSGTIVGSSATIPTVTDNLAVQGAISTESIGVYFTPTSGSFYCSPDDAFCINVDFDSSK